MAINTTNLVKFRKGIYTDAWGKTTGRDASTLYFAQHDSNGVGGLWLGDNLISSQIVDASLADNGKTLNIKKLNPSAELGYDTVSISLNGVETDLSGLKTRLSNIETILESSQSAVSARLDRSDSSVSAIETKLAGIEAGAQVNKLEAVKLNDSFVTIETDDTHGKYVDLGSIATTGAMTTAIEALDSEATSSDGTNVQVKVTEVDGKITAVNVTTDNTINSGNLTDAIAALDSSVEATAADGNQYSVLTGVTQTDGKLTAKTEVKLAAVAKTGTAADVTIADANNKITATNVEGALTELATSIEAANTNNAVTLDDTATPGEGILKVYTIKQGGTSIGTINIPKDLVATAGSLVYCTKSGNTYTEVDASTSGAIACIKMTIQNGNPFYIEVADLIEYNIVQSTDEITLTDTGHVISATVGAISSNKITFTPAGENPTDTTVQAALRDLYSQIGEGGSVASQIQTEIEKLDADLDATGAPTHGGTFVMSGVTEVDGKLTAVDSVEVEAAGAAAAAKATIDAYTVNGKAISTNPVFDGSNINVDDTASTKETVKDAIARLTTASDTGVDTKIQTEIEKLDSSVTATGTPVKNGVMVLKKVDQVDGKLNQAGSESIEVWAAEDSQAVADALTWESF